MPPLLPIGYVKYLIIEADRLMADMLDRAIMASINVYDSIYMHAISMTKYIIPRIHHHTDTYILS